MLLLFIFGDAREDRHDFHETIHWASPKTCHSSFIKTFFLFLKINFHR